MFQALFDMVRSTVWAIIVSVTIYGVFDINKNYANQKCSSLWIEPACFLSHSISVYENNKN